VKASAEPARPSGILPLALFVVIANSELGNDFRHYSHPNPTNGLLSFGVSQTSTDTPRRIRSLL
ncbi:hypothetical protein, partial [Aeromonas caviae]|uniref:hypothetical protein n=1 Tax=Aeromonas caviae TaxID=648 RepID=UPI002B495290